MQASCNATGHRTGGSEEVTGHALGRGDDDLAQVCAEDGPERPGLRDVVQRGGRPMRVVMSDP